MTLFNHQFAGKHAVGADEMNVQLRQLAESQAGGFALSADSELLRRLLLPGVSSACSLCCQVSVAAQFSEHLKRNALLGILRIENAAASAQWLHAPTATLLLNMYTQGTYSHPLYSHVHTAQLLCLCLCCCCCSRGSGEGPGASHAARTGSRPHAAGSAGRSRCRRAAARHAGAAAGGCQCDGGGTAWAGYTLGARQRRGGEISSYI